MNLDEAQRTVQNAIRRIERQGFFLWVDEDGQMNVSSNGSHGPIPEQDQTIILKAADVTF